MANLDTIILNASGQTVRTDIESNLQALKSNNSTGTDPAGDTLINYMSWANTSSNQFQVHNSSAFLPVVDISTGTSAGTHIAKPGTTAIPGYRFLNSSGTAVQSGMGLPADTRLGFFLGGTEKVSVLSTGQVGIGTTAPSETLTVLGNQTIYTTNSDAILNISALASDNSNRAYIDFVADTTYTDYGLRIVRQSGGANTRSDIIHAGTGALQFNAQDGGQIEFMLGTTASSTNVVRWKFNAAGGFQWAEHTGGGSPISGDILPRGIVGKTGANPGASTSNLYNFYWTGTALQCWIDAVHVGNVTITSSDYRIKENVVTQTESAINKIKQLRPVSYQFKDYEVFKGDAISREGFIADEVQQVIPSAVNNTKDGESIQSLNTDAIVSVLTKALQESVAKIETLETKVAALEAS